MIAQQDRTEDICRACALLEQRKGHGSGDARRHGRLDREAQCSEQQKDDCWGKAQSVKIEMSGESGMQVHGIGGRGREKAPQDGVDHAGNCKGHG